jgi:hypothetical protein
MALLSEGDWLGVGSINMALLNGGQNPRPSESINMALLNGGQNPRRNES